MPREVFLSHASADGKFADKVVAELRRHGVPVWYSATNILGAQQWHDEIGTALRRCDWFLVLISPHALQSFWLQRELFFALGQRRFVGRITPVLFEPCEHEELSWTFSAIQLVSFLNGFENGCRDLLRVWGIGYHSL